MGDRRDHIFEQTPAALAAWCENRGMKPFRAKQILEWVYEKGIADPQQMSNLSKLDRDTLARHMRFLTGDVIRRQLASDGTLKLLVQWRDDDADAANAEDNLHDASAGTAPAAPSTPAIALPQVGTAPDNDPTRQTECVMIPSEDRRTACISSQVGCPVGCKFCASGLGGLDSNLSTGRIIEQVWLLRKAMAQIAHSGGTLPTEPAISAGALPSPAINASSAAPANAATPRDAFPRITNVVFMGMGEPLSNLANVVPAIRTICSLWGMAISARKVTVSTVGLPKAIERLAEQLELPITLALSLHAPNDQIRRTLIPWAEYTTIADLLASCQRWFEKTGREITLEYTLLRDINDQPAHARELAQIAKSLRANINLIRYNEVQGMPFERPKDDDVRAFQQALRDRNLNVHIRASRGRDIAAACGQLRHETGHKQRTREAAGSGSARAASGNSP